MFAAPRFDITLLQYKCCEEITTALHPHLHTVCPKTFLLWSHLEQTKTKWLFSSFPIWLTNAPVTQQSHIHNDTHISSGSIEDCSFSTGRSDKERLVPNRGMASDTWGKVSATRFRNTVNESKMVTPVTEHSLNRAFGHQERISCSHDGRCWFGIFLLRHLPCLAPQHT